MAQDSIEENTSAAAEPQEAGENSERQRSGNANRRPDRNRRSGRRHREQSKDPVSSNSDVTKQPTDSPDTAGEARADKRVDNRERNSGQGGRSDNRSEKRERNDRNERTERSERGERNDRPQRHDRQSSKPSISVVIPLLNEEESLGELVSRLTPVLETETAGRYEVIFIDDGSTDGSYEVLRQLNRRNGKIHCLRFRRNYGKSAALAVGFAQAKNDIVITMDADLQDDPLEIPNLVQKINEGYDLVSGWKKRRKDPLEKRIPSKFFNFVTSTVSGIKLHDFNCGLKAYRREVIKTVQVYGEMHRYIPALAHWEGFRIAELPVTHHARKFGNSKFGFSRYFKGFLDLLTVVFTTRFIKRPLHLFGTLGALFTIAGFSIDLMLSIEWALNQTSLTNRPLMLMGIAFIIVGVQLISIGLVGEMIVKNSLSQAEYSIKERF